MVLALVVAVAAQDRPVDNQDMTVSGAKGGSPPVLVPHNPRYLLRVGDVLEISFRLTPEFNQTVTVQPDGFISVRDLQDIYVAGKSTPELVEMLRKGYSRILRDPVITILLKEFEKPYFIANGEVGRPGKFDLRGDTTVLEAIGIAGGFKESSKHSQVLLLRRVSDQLMSVKKLDVKAMLNSGDMSEDMHLRPGDMIYVPKNTISKVKPFLPIPTVGVGWYPW
jgi:polysaccharide biosynthesis/export protein